MRLCMGKADDVSFALTLVQGLLLRQRMHDNHNRLRQYIEPLLASCTGVPPIFIVSPFNRNQRRTQNIRVTRYSLVRELGIVHRGRSCIATLIKFVAPS